MRSSHRWENEDLGLLNYDAMVSEEPAAYVSKVEVGAEIPLKGW
jgi:hypothetical protein